MATVGFATHECGDGSEYDLSGGTNSIQTTTVRTGTYALKCPTTGSYRRLRTVDASGLAANANAATSYIRFYFLYLTKPVSNDEQMLQLQNAAAGTKLSLRLNSAGKIAAYDSTQANIATGTTVLSSGTWYRIEVKCATGATGAYEVKINGTSELSGSSASIGSSNAGRLYVGCLQNQNGNAIDFYYDDVLWSDSAYPGAGQGNMVVATANGNYTSGVATGAASLWQCLTQVPSDGDTSYIDSLLATQAYTAKFGGSGTSGGTINSVRALILTRNLGAGGSQSTRLRSGATDTDTTATAATSSYAPYSKYFDTDPNTGSAWTPANLDLAECGIVESIAGNRLTSAFIFFDWVPPPVIQLPKVIVITAPALEYVEEW